MKIKKRLSIEEYALKLAETAALRSEDPYQKVGACALSHENRVIGLAYNGVAPDCMVDDKFWKDRKKRRPFMIHAEQNLCALFKRGEARLIAVTICPCDMCTRMLIAHGIEAIIYHKEYTSIENKTHEICEFYGIYLNKL